MNYPQKRVGDLTQEEFREIVIEILKSNFSQTISPKSPNKIIGLTELCSKYGLIKSTVYYWTTLRLIPHSKVGKRLKFNVDDIEKWISDKNIKTKKE